MKGELVWLTNGSTIGINRSVRCEEYARYTTHAEQQKLLHFPRKGKHANVSVSRSNESIERLTEYRAALITAAVTGQIAGLQ